MKIAFRLETICKNLMKNKKKIEKNPFSRIFFSDKLTLNL